MNPKKKRRRKIILPPGYPTPKEIARVLKIPKKEQKQVDQILKKFLKPKKNEKAAWWAICTDHTMARHLSQKWILV